MDLDECIGGEVRHTAILVSEVQGGPLLRPAANVAHGEDARPGETWSDDDE